MVHIAESTIGRRYAGWFIKNTERTQKILDDLKSMPLPAPSKSAALAAAGAATGDNAGQSRPARTGAKIAWGSGVKAA